jgi:hypothetical protein
MDGPSGGKRKVKALKKTLSVLAMAFLLSAGCVSIYDSKVDVQPPGQVEQYNRSTIDQCTPHVYPHRLIQATTGMAYPYLQTGGGLVNDQVQFDQWWAGLSLQLDQDKVVSTNLKPVIDWTQQTAYFIPVQIGSPCQKVKPFGDEMTTDCYNITIPIYTWMEGENCQQPITSYPVFIYIYPKANNQPVGIQWIHPTPTPTFSPTRAATATPTATPTPTDEEDQ